MFDDDLMNGINIILGEDCVDDNDGDFDPKAPVIDRFNNKYDFLSNFYEAYQSSNLFFENEEGEIDMSMDRFKTLEHAFQASKTTNREQQLEIINSLTAKQAKRLGRKVDLVSNWETKKLEIMERLIEDKFMQNFPLKLKLLTTGRSELVEGNNWKDTFWGVTKKGGENNLGKILMRVRSRIVKDEGTLVETINDYFDRNGMSFVSDWIDPDRINL